MSAKCYYCLKLCFLGVKGVLLAQIRKRKKGWGKIKPYYYLFFLLYLHLHVNLLDNAPLYESPSFLKSSFYTFEVWSFCLEFGPSSLFFLLFFPCPVIFLYLFFHFFHFFIFYSQVSQVINHSMWSVSDMEIAGLINFKIVNHVQTCNMLWIDC